MRPGPYVVIFLPPGAGPKQDLSLFYFFYSKSLRHLASYYAQSNFYVLAHVPYLCRDVPMVPTRVRTYLPTFVHRMVGRFN